MEYPKRLLNESLNMILCDDSISKADLIDLLRLTIDDDLSTKQALSDFITANDIFESDRVDLELIMEHNENVYDRMKLEGLL
jgi:hypothetical protein